MTIELGLFLMLLTFVAGLYLGVKGERGAWVDRANTKEQQGKSAHYVDGQFFYIFEESLFVDEFKRKEVRGNGTQSSTS